MPLSAEHEESSSLAWPVVSPLTTRMGCVITVSALGVHEAAHADAHSLSAQSTLASRSLSRPSVHRSFLVHLVSSNSQLGAHESTPSS